MTCGRCGAPLPRPDVRFCTRCGAPVGAATPVEPQGGYQAYEQQQYEQPAYGPPPYGPPPAPPKRSSPLGPVLIAAALILVVLGGIAYWALTQMDNPPIAVGPARTPTPVPTPTAIPTPTRQPGLGINVPGPQGTPTTISVPLPIPGLGATPGAGAPSLPIPGLGNSGGGTPPPGAKLTADQARQKVKDSLQGCRVLHAEIDVAQVTFEAPTWRVRLPITGATWSVDDATGNVTADERATQRARTCR